MSIRLYELEAELNINPVILPQRKPDFGKVNMKPVDSKFIRLYNAIKSLQLEVCTKNPEEVSFIPKEFISMFKSFYGDIPYDELHSSIKSSMVYYNNLYLYPNMDNFFFTPHPPNLKVFHNPYILNNPLNRNFNDILKNPFSVRFDLRNQHNNLIVLQIYNMLVLDYDVKDFFKEVNEQI